MLRVRRPFRAAGWCAFGLAQLSMHLWRGELAPLYAAFMMLTVTGGAVLHGLAAWRAEGRARLVWTTTTVALACWAYAEISVGIPAMLTGVAPGRSLAANLLNLFALALTVVAMLAIPSAPRDRVIRLRMVLDGLVAASALGGVVWMLVLAPMIRLEGIHEAFFDLAYPVLAAGVLAVALVLLAGQPVRQGTAMTWITGGVVVLTIGLLVEVIGGVSDQDWLRSWIRGAYVTAAVLLTLSARAPLPSARERVWHPADAGLAPYLPVVGLCAAVTIDTALGRLLDPEVVWSAMVMVAALMIRQLLALRTNAALTQDLQNQQARLEEEASRDALTGLPNRAAFNAALAAAPREELALLMIDLDGFKAVNDTLGHGAGDQLLITVAERIRRAVSQFGTRALPSRLGGDEFAVLLHGSLDAASHLAEDLVVSLSTPMSLEGRPAMVGASVGIAVAPCGRDHERLLRDADLALYEAKSRGKGHYRVFDARMSAQVEARQTLEVELAGAIGGQQLRLHYQPIVDLETGRAHKAEALLRWEHPVRGLVGPDEFVPPAQEAGLLPSFDRWALGAAAAQVARWRQTQPDFSVSVNASAGYLASGGLLADVRRVLAEYELPGQALLVEVTENTLVANLDLAARTLADLQELGVRIALDDFGVGYSSLTYLRKLPVDVVKIDRSFVRDLDQQNPDAVFLIDTVITLTRRLGLDCVAEGIETPVQAARLRALGCKQGQGFLFARPAPADSAPPRAVGGVRVRS